MNTIFILKKDVFLKVDQMLIVCCLHVMPLLVVSDVA